MFIEIKKNINFGKSISSALSGQVKAKQDIMHKLSTCKVWMVKWRGNTGDS
ncbi:hypothetical protein [Sporomusa sp.]|uniref:hypothetical protein n=1 Tax=Sporomusa sp. TaxID=2078658 RepID=UPI002C97D5C5|nr:hypothetical protein [Sporomusa sp.]HWR05796.1 hypothetical protein [Sporomusa sp.]